MNSLSTGAQKFVHISKDCRSSNAIAQNCTNSALWNICCHKLSRIR